MKPYLWHPMAVHFTVALLIMAALFFVLARIVRKAPLNDELVVAGRWTLWTGTLLTIVTVALGLVAFNTVQHDDPSHALMKVHRAWALSTLTLFALLGIWVFAQRHKVKQPSLVFLVLMLAGVGLLGTTAWYGGELVYTHGLGVASLPKAGHHHHGGEGDHHDEADTRMPAGADNAMANMPGMAAMPASGQPAGAAQNAGANPANDENQAAGAKQAGSTRPGTTAPAHDDEADHDHDHAGHHHDD